MIRLQVIVGPDVRDQSAFCVEGDRGAGARENRGREGYGRREKKGREVGSL